MPKGYIQTPNPSEAYELVQLLRLNGVSVVRAGDCFKVHMAMNGSWKSKAMVLTAREFKARFGPGTTEHMLLMQHPKAGAIIKKVPQKSRASLA